MIKSVTVTNYLGDSLKLELTRPEKSGFIVKSIDGLGPVKANINTTEVSTNDGSIFNSARLNQRNITMNLLFMQTGSESIEDVRQKSYRYFPLKKKLTISIETDNRTLETDGYVESNEPNIFSKQEGCFISIVCPSSYFYSIDKNETVLAGIQSAFEFPFGNESIYEPLLEIGITNHYTERTVVYRGDSEIGITITIHALGDVENLTIYNLGTREVMRIDTDKIKALTGSGIITGDDIIISTIKGNKYITLLREGVTTNILNCLSKNTDWFRLSKGDNRFAFTAESGDSYVQLKIENKIIYEGV